jgi:hypothetical protein
MLLEARQALAVCLRAWQLQGWWPDPVGALMGVFPKASPAGEACKKEDEAARKAVSLRNNRMYGTVMNMFVVGTSMCGAVTVSATDEEEQTM